MPGHPRPRRGLWLPAVSPRGGWRQGARNPAKTPRSERRAPGRGKRLGPGRAAGGVPGGADRLTGDLGGAEAGAGEEGAGSPLALPPPPPRTPTPPPGPCERGVAPGPLLVAAAPGFLRKGLGPAGNAAFWRPAEGCSSAVALRGSLRKGTQQSAKGRPCVRPGAAAPGRRRASTPLMACRTLSRLYLCR